MLKKEDIIIKDAFPFLHDNNFEYDKNISDLCDLSNQIIEKYDIKTLSTIEIYFDSLLNKKLGQAIYNFNHRTSKVQLDQSIFSNFNRKEQEEIQQKALATIYHEFYHIYDKENYWDMFLTRLPNNDKTYFQTGSKYWGEFYAYYKSGEIYADEYVVNEVTKLYSKSKTKKLDESEQQSYFYFISKFIAFSLNDKCKFKLPNNKMLTFIGNC